ncbi:hypothetical protein ACN28S_62170 [Cystobacter fuscus]
MRLEDVQALLDASFQGVEEGAARMNEPGDSRFDGRQSAVWLEYRWYVEGRGLGEVFVKWKRVDKEACADTQVDVLRIHLLGQSDVLAERARRVLLVGTPSAGRLLELLDGDGVRRETSRAGPTGITLEYWPPPEPRAPLLPTETFQALASVLGDATATFEERHEAVDRLCRERSARVVDTLLAALDVGTSLSALRRLSEWGETEALPHLERALAGLEPDNASDLWTLLALQRRLQAWSRIARVI